MHLSGRSRDLKINAAGASHLDLKDFPVDNAAVHLSGASHSQVNLNGQLDVSLEGASKLEYRGRVVMGNVKVTGASTLKQD